MIVLLGGGTKPAQLEDGALKHEYFWRRWINAYADRLAGAGLADRREKMHPALRKYLEEPAEAAAAAA
jgi:hypothetical protein